MSIALKLYLIDFVCSLPWVTFVAGLIYFIWMAIRSKYDIPPKDLKKIGIVILVSFVLMFFIPSPQKAYLYLGLHETEEYLKGNDKAQQLPQLAVEALHEYLKESKIGN